MIFFMSAVSKSRLQDGSLSEFKKKVEAEVTLANGFPSLGPR